jgi:membrane-associated phospholipid phosphatase
VSASPLAFALAVLAAHPTSVTPEPEPAATSAVDESPDIRFRVAIDVPVFLGFSAIAGLTEGFKPMIAPQACLWCQPGPVARGVRNALVWDKPESAALTSDILGFAVVPAYSLTMTLVGVGVDGEWRRVHEDLLVALEAVAVSTALTNVLKFSSARQRPYSVYADEPISFDEDPDQFLSFPSGHTSLAFSIATSFATVATLRDRELAPALWAVGVPMAAFVGYLRIAGDRHWVGDVLAGAGLGTLVGVGLPWLLHHPRTGVLARRGTRSKAHAISVLPTGTGLSIAGRM